MKAKDDIPTPESQTLGLYIISTDDNGNVYFIDMLSLFGN